MNSALIGFVEARDGKRPSRLTDNDKDRLLEMARDAIRAEQRQRRKEGA